MAQSNPGPHYYPQGAHLLEDLLKPVCSEQGGITQSLLVSPLEHADGLDLRSITAQMPPYHKVLLDADLEMQYHLGGYGTFHEEALVRLAGEIVERYSLLVAQCTLRDRIVYASYDEIARRGNVVPLEYLRPFSDADYAKVNRGGGHRGGLHRLERSDVVGWLACPSIFEPGSEIWVPAQMLLVGYHVDRKAGEVRFAPAFSTGTAAHRSVEKAFHSALLEVIEIDALMLHWYTQTPAPAVALDSPALAALAPKLLSPDSRYEVLALDLRLLEGVDAHAFASIIVNRRGERPYITLGAQAHLDPVKAVYRSLMEAVAISFLGSYGPLFLPREYLSSAGAGFTDLDTNVAFFASPENAREKRLAIDALVSGKAALSGMKNLESGDPAADTRRLVEQLSRHSAHGVYLDVTAPETHAHGWRVMRVFIPELVTMCVPGAPYSEHPRMKRYGGIRNVHPHPLP